MFKVNTYIL